MIPKTMRAAVLEEIGKLHLRDVPVPKPGPGEVLLRVVRASVCNGSDSAVWSGRRKIEVAYPWMKLPWVLGHECAGEVAALGDGVTAVHVGDRVASIKYGNAFADYQVAKVEELIPVPDGMTFDEATFLEVTYATHSYFQYVQCGDRVVVMGLGPSGILLLQQALAAGADHVIGADRHNLRLEIARKVGAHSVVHTEREDLAAQVRETIGEADVFIDATGWDVFDEGIRLLRRGGRLVMYGVPDSGVHYDGTRAYFRGIVFCQKGRDHAGVLAGVRRLLDREVLDFRRFVTHHFPLEEVPEAVRMASEQPGKCLAIVIDVAE